MRTHTRKGLAGDFSPNCSLLFYWLARQRAAILDFMGLKQNKEYICEVEGAIASPRSIPPADSFEKKREGNVPDGKRSSERRNMRTTDRIR
ncbi:hypothetical protein TNCV_3079781 [Trichonephila clavipes]|nr:hypothetical protein TNCV_3079781 [Trichonephila clavipes]